jgi:cytochrome c556
MMRLMSGAFTLLLVAACAVLLGGCGDETSNAPGAGGPASKGFPGAGPGPGAASNPKLKAIMTKVGKGPQSLQDSLKAAMKEQTPAWDAIGTKAKEYAQLAAETGKYDPPRGDKSSWTKLTQGFAESASDLDQAAQAKDKEKTLLALDGLGNSCQSCHRQHRMMRGPGGGGPPGGRPPGGFPPPQGGGPPGGPPPPQGGPAGPPPGGGPGGPATK